MADDATSRPGSSNSLTAGAAAADPPGGPAPGAGPPAPAGGGTAGTGPGTRAASVTLPKGGGAVRGIGEKFAVNAANGTASLTVPLPFSPGRDGWTPDLHLTYDS